MIPADLLRGIRLGCQFVLNNHPWTLSRPSQSSRTLHTLCFGIQFRRLQGRNAVLFEKAHDTADADNQREDALLQLAALAEPMGVISNEEMDRAIYGV